MDAARIADEIAERAFPNAPDHANYNSTRVRVAALEVLSRVPIGDSCRRCGQHKPVCDERPAGSACCCHCDHSSAPAPSAADEGVWHFLVSPGTTRCGADYSCMMATEVAARVTCEWCKRGGVDTPVPSVAQPEAPPVCFHGAPGCTEDAHKHGCCGLISELRRENARLRGSAAQPPVAQDVETDPSCPRCGCSRHYERCKNDGCDALQHPPVAQEVKPEPLAEEVTASNLSDPDERVCTACGHEYSDHENTGSVPCPCCNTGAFRAPLCRVRPHNFGDPSEETTCGKPMSCPDHPPEVTAPYASFLFDSEPGETWVVTSACSEHKHLTFEGKPFKREVGDVHPCRSGCVYKRVPVHGRRRNFNELIARMSPEAQRRANARAEKMSAELDRPKLFQVQAVRGGELVTLVQGVQPDDHDEFARVLHESRDECMRVADAKGGWDDLILHFEDSPSFVTTGTKLEVTARDECGPCPAPCVCRSPVANENERCTMCAAGLHLVMESDMRSLDYALIEKVAENAVSRFRNRVRNWVGWDEREPDTENLRSDIASAIREATARKEG